MAAQKAFGINVLALSKGLDKVGREVTQLGRTLEDFNRKTATATLDVETRKAQEKVGAFARDLQTRIERAVRSLPDIKLGADASAVDRRIREIRRELASIADKRVGVGVDTTTAQARVDRLSSELNRLSRRSVNVQVKADTAAASAQLAGISRQASRIDGQRVAISVNASDVSRAISLVGLLTAALAGASALVGPAAAGIAALGPAASAGAQGIGAIAAGFSGVGDAVKALSQEQTKTAAGTAVSAASQVNSAQAIASAQRGVQRATEQADRAAITGAQQVADARRALDSAIEQGSRQVTAASQSLTRAQRDERDAQQALNLARADAIEQLQQLGFSVEEADIAQQRATLRLAEARAALADTAADPSSDAYKTLALDVKEAELQVRETADRFSDLKTQSTAAAKAGVEGSAGVIAAQRQAADATQGVRDAETQLAQARTDSAKQVAQAQGQLARAQQQAAFAQQDAAAAVADAQTALANAYADTGTQGRASANKVKEAFADLSPEAQHFAKFLVGEVIPGLHKIRDEVQASLLPRMETSLRNMGELGPVVSAGLAGTGKVIGDLSVKGSEMLTSGPWRRDFATIMGSNNRALSSFGDTGLSAADSLRNLTVVAGPMVERFAALTASAAQQADTFLTSARASGELDRFFDQMGDEILDLVHVCGQIVTAFVQVSQALGPLGGILLETIGNLAQWIGELAQAYPGVTQLIGVLALGATAFSKLGTAMAGIVALKGTVLDGWRSIADAVGKLAPSSIAGTAAMQRVSAALDTAEMAVGRYTDRMFVSTAAQERFNTTGARWGGVATRVASTIPALSVAVGALALAYDGLVTSTDEAAKAILEGGAAAERVRQSMSWQDTYVRNAHEMHVSGVPVLRELTQATKGVAEAIGWLIPTSGDAAAKAREMYNNMTPLAQAQKDAADAAYAYGQAVKQHGPDSWQAAQAADALALATDRVESEQRQAGLATKNLTDRLFEQQNQMLANVNADLAFQQSQLAVESAQKAYADAVANSGVKSSEANQALLALQQSMLSSVQAAGQAATAANAHKSATEQNKAALKAQDDEIFRLLGLAGANAPEALKKMAAGMSDADLRARDAKVSVNQLGERIVELPGGPGKPPVVVKIGADTGAARRAIEDLRRDAVHQVINIPAKINAAWTGTPPPRAAGSIDYRPMASGGYRSMASGVAAVVPANTPTLIGDHPRVPESYIPWDRSARSNRILDVTNAAMGRGALPMAAGGALTTGATAGTGDMFAGLTDSAEELQKAGLQPLAKELTGTTVPTLETLQQHAEQDTPNAIQALTGVTQASTTTMVQSWVTLGQRLTAATAGMGRDMLTWQGRSMASWQAIAGQSNAMVGQITGPQYGAMHRGMDSIQIHSTNMANWVGGQYARLRGLTADPIRWSLTFPINRGLVPAWAAIDRFFALNRPMGPVPIGFEAGGPVRGGVPGKDSVPIMAMEDEFVVRREIARPTRRFLESLNAGQPEALQAAGGRYAKFAAGGPVQRGLDFARAQHGKPYIWGAVGPQGFDCSGFISAITNTLLGAYPYRRVGSTDSAPWAGWSRGLSSAFGVGFSKGNPGHMAGTLGGANVEAGGSPSMTKFIQNAAGARSGQFTGHMSLPQVGGQFIGGGDGGIDVGAYVRGQMGPALRMVSDLTRFFGPGTAAVAAQSMARQSIDGAIRWVERTIPSAPTAGSGPVRAQVQNVARRWGWGGGPQWANLDALITKESGWNPTAQNPVSTAYGLYQFLDSVWGTVGGTKTSNPALQAEYGNRYIKGRYGDPIGAWAFHRAHNWYDSGGLARGSGWMFKDTIRPERVLDPRTTEAFERLVAVLNTHRGMMPVGLSAAQQSALSGAISAARQGVQEAVTKHFNLTVYNAANTRTDLETQFRRLELKAGV